MVRSNPTQFFLTALLALPVHSWNADVHNQIGFIAEQFLAFPTTIVVNEILAFESANYSSLGQAAAWADQFAHDPEGTYSKTWHYIDAHDNPLNNSCNVDWPQACEFEQNGGCVVSAIDNQTSILKRCVDDVLEIGHVRVGTGLECVRALKWVSHFLGDVTQPLHASSLDYGGNLRNVTFGGKTARLHAVWDGHIIYADAGNRKTPFSNKTIDPFFQNIATRIQLADDFLEPTKSFVQCADPSLGWVCPLAWSLESNRWTCDYVYKHQLNGTDLFYDGYAQGAFKIVELQVAKAGLRLATWLNRLVVDGPDARKDNEQVRLGGGDAVGSFEL